MTEENKVPAPLQRGDYGNFWSMNCGFCSKSPHRSGDCEIQKQLCFANVSLYGMNDQLPPTPELSRILGSGTIPQDIANRLGLDEKSDRLPGSCPEQEVVFQGQHEREAGMTAEKLEQMAQEYERKHGSVIPLDNTLEATANE